MKHFILAASIALASTSAFAADVIKRTPAASLPVHPSQPVTLPIFKGRVAVMDGRTLWFPTYAKRVRLADIDACELPQWALDPKWTNREVTKAPPPVPCGPFAKAWLKRTIGSSAVTCAVVGYDDEAMPRARCTSRGHDLALEMLRVGWARVDSPYLTHPQYMGYQRAAMSARYGMWATYVLDMNEWRRKAVDRTLDRQPIADFNLLAERKSEISPLSPMHAESQKGQTDSCRKSLILRSISRAIPWPVCCWPSCYRFCLSSRRQNLVGPRHNRGAVTDDVALFPRAAANVVRRILDRRFCLSRGMPRHSKSAPGLSRWNLLVLRIHTYRPVQLCGRRSRHRVALTRSSHIAHSAQFNRYSMRMT